ncbi:MAG: hypothetical protein AAFN74_13560 [Myxococcota bacterium]
MKRLASLSLVLFAACGPERSAGPEVPFTAEARPRNPDHFIVGNGSEIPLPYDVVRSLAISSGVPGMINFELQDWFRPGGRIELEQVDGASRYRLTLTGLVPGGLYTAWLVRISGSARGPKRDLGLSPGYDGPRPSSLAQGTNLILADDDGEATRTFVLDPLYTDASDQTYFGVDFWDEVHVAFHADNRAYGFIPGPNHWTQVVLPIRPDDGSAIVGLSPTDSATLAATAAGVFTDAVDAIAARGVAGASDYSEAQWDGASGHITFNLVDFGTTQDVNVVLTADGLIPQAAYSAWLVSGSRACPIGEVTVGEPATRPLFGAQAEVDERGRGYVRAVLTEASECIGGERFRSLEDWSHVELRLHPLNRFEGLSIADTVPHLTVAVPEVVLAAP